MASLCTHRNLPSSDKDKLAKSILGIPTKDNNILTAFLIVFQA